MSKSKAECESQFVDYVLSVGGIEKHCEMDEGRKTYYQFWLKNGEIRHWTNMSAENLERISGSGAE